MKTLDHWDGAGTEYSDVWGFTINGAEIAIIGSESKIHFFDVTNPSSIKLIHEEVGGSTTSWRDIKSYGNYVYTVSDVSTNEGLHIFDMSGAPNTINKVLTTTAFFTKAHNIFIDEANARLYACGTNTLSNGLIVLDLSTPTNPTLLANVNLGFYSHDLYVSNHRVHCNHGYDGYYIYDFTDLSNVSLLGSYLPPNPGYNHSSWNTPDDNYAIFAEELPSGKPLRIIDISNPALITLESSWKEPLLAPAHTNNRPHNPIILNNWAYVSYYGDGVQIIDISDKSNPTRIAYFDTSNNTSYGGFPGVWGVYPLLPSGIILASDIDSGLYVFQIDFSIVVPVDYSEFSVQKSANNRFAKLNWETATEINNSHFEIQRSTDGKLFSKIGIVEGFKNSHVPSSYEFVDKNPQIGQNFYRLKQVDHSGNSNYSSIEHVSFRALSSVHIYPNPGKGKRLTIEMEAPAPGQYEVYLLDSSGKQLYTKSFEIEEQPVSKQIVVEMDQLIPAGVYHWLIMKDFEINSTLVYLVN